MEKLQYLKTRDRNEDNDFTVDQLLFRHFANTIEPKELFTEISSEYIENGISCNWSKAEHSLYKSELVGNDCVWTMLESKSVYSIKVQNILNQNFELQIENQPTLFLIKIQHNPTFCNYSHTVICIQSPLPLKSYTKRVRKGIKTQFVQLAIAN